MSSGRFYNAKKFWFMVMNKTKDIILDVVEFVTETNDRLLTEDGIVFTTEDSE